MNSHSTSAAISIQSYKALKACWIFFTLNIFINVLNNVYSVGASCLASNCNSCNQNSPYCLSCNTPFLVNSYGYCDASSVCEQNQFYSTSKGSCVDNCASTQIENPILNFCDQVNNCSSNNNIGNNYLRTEFNAPIFFDQVYLLYIQATSSNQINIYDSATLQFQASITTVMTSVSNQFYDSTTQNIVVTNVNGLVEIWNVLSTNLIYSTTVLNYDGTSIYYIPGLQKVFYLNTNKNLTVIDNFSSGASPTILLYQLVNTAFSTIYLSDSQTMLFAGNQLELLHMSMVDYTQLFYNAYNTQLPITGVLLYRPTMYSDFAMLYRLQAGGFTMLYYPQTRLWINSTQVVPTVVGEFLGQIYQRYNQTHYLFYNIDPVSGNLTTIGPYYPLTQSYFVAYDNQTMGIGLLISSTSTVTGPHIRFSLNFTAAGKFTASMITNIVQFNLQVTNMILLDDINRRLITRGADGNILVTNIDTLQVVFSIKQFQQSPLSGIDVAFMIVNRVDPVNQINLYTTTVNEIQNVNLINNKRRMKSAPLSGVNFWNAQPAQNYMITQMTAGNNIYIFLLSNMQRAFTIAVSSTTQDNIVKCVNPFFMVNAATSNDFITVCKSKIVYWPFVSATTGYGTPTTAIALTSTTYVAKEMAGYIIICYTNSCSAYLKTSLTTPTTIVTGITQGFTAINARSDQTFFALLTNSSSIIFVSYPAFTVYTTFQLPSTCLTLIGYGFFEGNRAVFACRLDLISIQVTFFVLTLTTTPSVIVTCQVMVVNRLITYLNIIDSQTVFTFYTSGVNLYFYMYAFQASLPEVIEKAGSFLPFTYSLPYPQYDTALRRVYFTYNSMAYANTKFVGEYQIWSYSYNNHYYDILDTGNTNTILKFSKCIVNSYVVSVVRSNYLYINDGIHNLEYRSTITGITDVFVDSTINMAFYLVGTMNIVLYNYVTSTIVFTFTHTSLMTDFYQITNPTYSNTFLAINRSNLDLTMCQYTSTTIVCYKSTLLNTNAASQTGITITSVQTYASVALVTDSSSGGYYINFNPTLASNQITQTLFSLLTTNYLSIYPAFSILVYQTPSASDGYVANINGRVLSTLKYNAAFTSVIAIQNDYLFVSASYLVRLNQSFQSVQTITTSMLVKKAAYYSSKNIVLLISTQPGYYNYISFYDITTQLQLQSLQVGSYPLQDIVYFPDEDKFVTYNLYGQIFRIDLNQPDQKDYIVNVFEADTGSITSSFFPTLFGSKALNKLYFANTNTVHKWNYSPFIGQRLNYKIVRYLQYYAVQNLNNPDTLYFTDYQSFIWAFQNNQQLLLQQAPSEVQDLYVNQNNLVAFCYQNVLIYNITNYGNNLLYTLSITNTTIQYSMQFSQTVFGYITDAYNFWIYNLTTAGQYATAPVWIATLSAMPQDFILIASDTVIISLVNSSPVKYKLGDTGVTSLTTFPICKGFLGAYTVAATSTIYIIEQANIISINQSTLALNLAINFPEYDQAGSIESFVFDDTQQLIYFHWVFNSFVSIIPYSLNKANLVFIGAPDIYQVKFSLQASYVAIYCQFQINFHNRDPNLTLLYYYRQPTVINSMTSLLIVNDLYLIVTQRTVVNILTMTPLSAGSRTFTLYKSFNSNRATIFQALVNSQGNIKLQGIGQDGYFNNLIVLDSECQNTFTGIKNKLNLKNQVNLVSIQNENIQKYYYFNIQLDPTQAFSSLPFINDLQFTNNNALITYIPSTTQQTLTLNNNIFSQVNIVDLVINDFTFIIPSNTNNISFNSVTKVVFISSISINQDLTNVCFNFTNLQRVVIDQLTITDITITDSVVFNITNVQSLTISNLNIINTNFVRSQLIYVLNAQNIQITNLQIQSIKLFEYNNKMLINICNSNALNLSVFFLSDIIGTNIQTSALISTSADIIERDLTFLQQQVNHVFYLQKIETITIQNGNCYQLQSIQMVKIEDFYTNGVILQTLEQSFVTIQSVVFKTNIGMFSLSQIKASNVLIYNVTAFENSCSDCNGAIFLMYSTTYVNITASKFDTNVAIHGGSVSLQQCTGSSNYITNCIFQNNIAHGSGGSLYLDTCELNMNTTNFISNSAMIGGALRYQNYAPIFLNGINNILNTINFSKNTAKIYGKNYGSYLSKISLLDLSNSVITGTYQPTNYTFQTLQVNTFQSGGSIALEVQMLDEEQELISFNPTTLGVSKTVPSSIRSEFQKIILNMVSNADEILIEGSNFATYQQFNQTSQLFMFPSSQLIAQPTKTGTLFIQTNVDFQIPQYLLDKYAAEASSSSLINGRMLATSNFNSTINSNQYSITLNFQFRDCQVGEIYQNISDTKTSCQICATGTYSLALPSYFEKQQCNQCSQQDTKECGNNTIILKDGYWRISEASDVIIECENRQQNCVDSATSRNYCIEGMVGPLCETCDVLGQVWGKPYSQTLQFQCAPCTDYFDTYVRWVFLFIGVNLYILGTLWVFFQIYRQKAIIYYLRLANMICFGNTARRDQSSTYLKFLINYAQLQSNINQFKYDIFVLSIPTMFGQPVSQLNTATDCQVVVYQNKLLVKTAAMLCLPILFYIWICAIYLLKSIFSKRLDDYWKLSSMKLYSLFLFSFTVFQPNIVSFLIQSLSCRLIGGTKYVTSDITMQCYNDEHIYVIILACFGILLWVVIVPLYIFFKLKKLEHVEWITKQYCYGFLYLEFKKQSIYWELVRLQLKLLVVIFINLLIQSPVTQFTCLSLTLFGYYHLVHILNPYETLHMNKVDKQMIFSLTVQLVLNAILKDLNLNSNQYMIVMTVCVVVNISTFSFLILTILLSKIQFIRQNIIKFKYKLQQIPCIKHFGFLQVAIEVESNFKRFKLWKQLSSNLQYAIAACQRVKYQQLRENYLVRSQNMKGQTQVGKSSEAQKMRESAGFDMMFRELDSITVKRGNSSLPTQVRGQTKQLSNAKQLYLGDQLNLTMEAEGSNSPHNGPSQINQHRLTNDQTNTDILNSVLGKDSKYVGQNSIPYHPNTFAQNKHLKVSVSYSNSPLQNSSNSLSQQQQMMLEKASPFKLAHNGILGKQLFSNRSNADTSPLVDNDNLIPLSSAQSGISLNHIASTAAMSNNLIGNSSGTQLNHIYKAKQIGTAKTQDMDDMRSPPSLSHNVSALVQPKYQEGEEDESRIKFEAVGLKSFNSQINPKIISDENLNNPPNGPRHMTSSGSSNDQVEEDEDDEEIRSNQKSLDSSIPYDGYKIQESPTSNLPSQLDRYSYPTDLLMKISKR